MFCGSLACASPAKKKESFANPLFASPVCAPPKFTIEKLRFVRFVPPAIAVPRGRWRSVYIPFTERGRRTLFTGWGEGGGGQQFVRNRVSGKVAAIPIPRARISMSNRLFCGGCVPVSATPSPGKVHFSTHTPRIKMGHQTNVVQETAAWLAWDAFRFRPPPAPGRGGRLRPIPFYLTATPLPPTPCVRVIDRRNGRCAPKLAPGLSDGYGASDGAAGQPCVLQCFCTF